MFSLPSTVLSKKKKNFVTTSLSALAYYVYIMHTLMINNPKEALVTLVYIREKKIMIIIFFFRRVALGITSNIILIQIKNNLLRRDSCGDDISTSAPFQSLFICNGWLTRSQSSKSFIQSGS